MKIVISESQYNRLIETEEKQKVLTFSSLDFFDSDPEISWNKLQEFMRRRGNPPYSISGDLDLRGIPTKSLGNLVYVDGFLDLYETNIESLGNLQSVGGNLHLYFSKVKSLGSLKSVGGDLDLRETSIDSFGNLKFVGGNLFMDNSQLVRMYSETEIREMVHITGYFVP